MTEEINTSGAKVLHSENEYVIRLWISLSVWLVMAVSMTWGNGGDFNGFTVFLFVIHVAALIGWTVEVVKSLSVHFHWVISIHEGELLVYRTGYGAEDVMDVVHSRGKQVDTT